MALSFFCSSAICPQHQVNVTFGCKNSLQNVKNLIKSIGVPSKSCSPHESLRKGNWVKLICGASFEDVVDIRNLSLVYTLAGVNAVNEGIETAREIVPIRRPWVMISVNDDEDLHFRKAEFDPKNCPSDCSRPCEIVCPANAIFFERETATMEVPFGANRTGESKGGVMTERCYGCGRCFPVCPYDKIREVTYVRDAMATAELLKMKDVDAVEIHTSGRQTHLFGELWDELVDSIRYLRLVAVSLPDNGDATISSMNEMHAIMEPHLSCFNLWQLDGRPMSGDIGRGATRESIAFAVRLAASRERPPGFLQLAGGTNAHTVDGLKQRGLFQTHITSGAPKQLHSLIGGIAYGGYARKIVGRVLSSMHSQHGLTSIEHHPEHLLEALKEALHLVGTVKSYKHFATQP
ncbi:4Fe-4S ferredoxin, iron-sulfur binding isoform 2 [Theobroma cacao]|uniref:4Fe-4S ferredoxin, iron-sulfur binding isoform 2 n=1 Tax=Theobroma cacao TaxID=3641 RepID=A0A061EQV2_THECC|nr:4Fe-4S ferredoxin, iron-sulfur binding isoform 2 [Theobroma cacao]